MLGIGIVGPGADEHAEDSADRRQHEFEGRRRRNRVHRWRGKRLGHRLHLAFAVDHHRLEKARVVCGQVVVALEDVVANVVEQVRGTADPDGRGRGRTRGKGPLDHGAQDPLGLDSHNSNSRNICRSELLCHRPVFTFAYSVTRPGISFPLLL